MVKQLHNFLLSLALLTLFNSYAEGQSSQLSRTEIVGDFDGQSYTFQTELSDYVLIRTDYDGAMVWISPLRTFGADSIDMMTNQNKFIVAGLTNYNKREKRIKGNPWDYEYWLVPFDEISDGFICIPNPTKGRLTAIIEKNSKISSFRIYDNVGRVISVIQNIGEQQIEIDLSSFNPGSYLIEGLNDSGYMITTVKIIKQ